MNVEGTVQISIKDFDELRASAKWFEELRNKLKNCSSVDEKEINEDEWIRIINVDARKIAKIAAEFSDVEERYEDDEINLINVQLTKTEGFEKTLSANHRTLLECGYPIDQVLRFSKDEAEGELEAIGVE